LVRCSLRAQVLPHASFRRPNSENCPCPAASAIGVAHPSGKAVFLLLPAIARSSANAPYLAHMKKPGKARLLMRFRQLTVVSCIPEVAQGGSSNQPATITIWNPSFRKKQQFDVLRDVSTKLVTPIARSNRFKHLIMTYKYYMPNLSKKGSIQALHFCFFMDYGLNLIGLRLALVLSKEIYDIRWR